jgi:uncharacterized protein YndB with AHSA1/START domain
MIWLLIIPGVLILLILALVVFGCFQPVKHSVTRSLTLKQKPEAVFAAVDNVDQIPSWSSMVAKVEHIPDRDGKPAARQTMKFGMTLIVTTLDRDPPFHLVSSMEKEGGPVWGTWTYAFTPDGDGCRIAITEDGEMKNPFFRALGRIRGLDTSIKVQLTDLASKFGENPEIR